MKHIFSLLLLISSSFVLKAQSSFFKDPSFSISIIQHSIGMPFKDFIKKPFNLGVSFAAEFYYDDRHLQKLEFGFYKHKHLHSAVWVKTDFVRRFQHEDGLFGEVQTGLGFIRDFHALDTYELDRNGEYRKMKSHGKGGFIAGAGLTSGYRFVSDSGLETSPFLRYQGFLQMPYSKIAPVFPHSIMEIGTRFQNISVE